MANTQRTFKNGIVETSTSTGTGNLVLQGPKTGYFQAPIGTVLEFHILMGEHSEISSCEVIDGGGGARHLQRLTCRASSNGGAFVDFPTGEKVIAAAMSAEAMDEIWTALGLKADTSALHDPVTVSAPISISGQSISMVNNAMTPAVVTTIDVGALDAASDVKIPTSKAVAEAISDKADKGEVAGINNQTGTTYTFVASDAGKVVRLNNANPISVTVPANASTAIAVNTIIHISQTGAGQATMVADTGVTLNGELNSAYQYAYLTLVKVDTDIWDCIGGVE